MNKTYHIIMRQLGIKLEGARTAQAKSGRNDNCRYVFCPFCHAQREKKKSQKQRELFLNLTTGTYHCMHCGKKGRMDSDQFIEKKEQYLASRGNNANRGGYAKQGGYANRAPHPLSRTSYKLPVINRSAPGQEHSDGIDTPFSAEVLTYLTQQRAIPLEVLHQMRIGECLELNQEKKKYEHAIVFNYYEQGMLINQKFRTLDKRFLLTKGAELIPYNIDAILGTEDVIITEGEFDTLALVAAQLPHAISMPSGAQGGTSWMDRFYDLHFEPKQRIYLATDMDAPGMKAADELALRLGPERCYRVIFSPDCKDANDELIRHGAEALRQRIKEAQPLPLKDIKLLPDIEEELDTYYQLGPQEGEHTGWINLDQAGISFGLGQLALITGRTNDGKSEWLDELVLRLMLRTGWHTAYWSPENTQLDHCQKIIEKLCNRQLKHQGQTGVQPEMYQMCKQWMAENMAWIDLRSSEQKLKTLLEKAQSLVRKMGIKLLVIDPFNFIEKENGAYMSENAWDSHVVGTLRDFAMEHQLLIFLVAHPRKVEMQQDGRKRRITMEDISGTADFGNKADYCFCVDRDDERGVVTVSIDKVRRKMYGSKGKQVYFWYNKTCGRYVPCEQDPTTKKPVLSKDPKHEYNLNNSHSNEMWLQQEDLFGPIEGIEF